MNEEGRVLVFEYDDFYLMNAYVPNSKEDLSRLKYRTETWEPLILEYVTNLQKKKPVIFCGDFNVAPSDIDIYNHKNKKNKHGFTIEEKTAFHSLLQKGKLVDVYRYFNPTNQEYTWFSNFHVSRKKIMVGELTIS